MGHDIIDLARLAAFVDGEGTIGLYGGNGRSVFPSLTVIGTCNLLMGWLLSTFGGQLYTNKIGRPGYKPVFSWQAPRAAIPYLLAAIQDLLIIKKRQCWLLREYMATCYRAGYRHPRLTEEDRALRLGFKLAMNALNKTGPVAA